MFSFSKGKNKFDNLPEQCHADTFKEFATDILYSVSEKKGGTYVCASLSNGHHKNLEKFPQRQYWRQQHLALARRFLAFDCDGFETPEVFEELQEKFPWDGFIYTTASHTNAEPRARAFLQLNREVYHDEGVMLGKAAQAYLESLITSGGIKFDRSVYHSTQPIYTPVTGFKTFRTRGAVLDVDGLLAQYKVEIKDLPNKLKKVEKSRTRSMGSEKGDFLVLSSRLDDTPNNVAKIENLLKKISSDCDRDKWMCCVFAILSTGFECAEALAYEWSIKSDRYTDTDFNNLITDYVSDGRVSIGTLYFHAMEKVA